MRHGKMQLNLGLDVLETRLFKRGMKNSDTAAMFYIEVSAYDRPEVRAAIELIILSVTMQEHAKRLERMGLPVPILEGDYQVIENELRRETTRRMLQVPQKRIIREDILSPLLWSSMSCGS